MITLDQLDIKTRGFRKNCRTTALNNLTSFYVLKHIQMFTRWKLMEKLEKSLVVRVITDNSLHTASPEILSHLFAPLTCATHINTQTSHVGGVSFLSDLYLCPLGHMLSLSFPKIIYALLCFVWQVSCLMWFCCLSACFYASSMLYQPCTLCIDVKLSWVVCFCTFELHHKWCPADCSVMVIRWAEVHVCETEDSPRWLFVDWAASGTISILCNVFH